MGEKREFYYGGQAVVEGVMMRGLDTWAVAVRRPSQEIYIECNPVRGLAAKRKIFRKPLFRGVAALVDALSIGMRALTISANQSVEEEEQLTKKQTAFSMVLAMLFFIGFFIVLPAFVSSDGVLSKLPGNLDERPAVVVNLFEGAFRIAIFLGYLLLISLMKEIRRVFMYHGAEHKTIAAHEAGEPVLEPEVVDKYSTLHVRCGTNFLIMVMILAVLVYSFFPRMDWWARILSRVGAVPLIAGLSYEMLRIGAAHLDNWFVRGLMKPGLWLQKITTRPPTHDQIEVAIRAFEAVLPEPQRGIIPALPSALVYGASSVEAEGAAAGDAAEPAVSPPAPAQES